MWMCLGIITPAPSVEVVAFAGAEEVVQHYHAADAAQCILIPIANINPNTITTITKPIARLIA